MYVREPRFDATTPLTRQHEIDTSFGLDPPFLHACRIDLYPLLKKGSEVGE